MAPTPQQRPNRFLDTAARPRLRVLRRERSAFLVSGFTGLAVAILLGAGLTLYRGLSLWVLLGVVLTACATFLALAMAMKIVTGHETLIYYHHEVAILATVTLMLWALGQPVPAYLDVTLLGVGTFLFFGRVGCFMVGCCYGRPSRWGVCYGRNHADAGFAAPLVGVRLFPVQLVESAWVFATVAVGVAMVLRGAPPGAALAWYVVVYGVGRFGFEFLRGDPERPYWAGFSEGQWTTLLLILVVVGAELRGAIPPHAWHLAAAGGVLLTMIGLTLHRRFRRDARHHLLSARHVQEVAAALELIDAVSETDPPHFGRGDCMVVVARTSAGLSLSAGRLELAEGELRHYTLSTADRRLTEEDAHAVADLLLRFRREGQGEVVQGREGVFHLIVHPVGAPGVSAMHRSTAVESQPALAR